uniref:Proline dehydrogenase n=1 Tax=Meloidogyne javanica TaxID=6303 RepID=A0A915M231_MELJA
MPNHHHVQRVLSHRRAFPLLLLHSQRNNQQHAPLSTLSSSSINFTNRRGLEQIQFQNKNSEKRCFSSLEDNKKELSAKEEAQQREVENCYKRIDLSFENAKEAFKSKSNLDLARALLVFRCCQIDWLVQNNQRILRILRKVLGQELFKRLLKSTFYGHFVAGEALDEVSSTVSKLQSFGIKSILDYSVEADISSAEAQEKAVEGIKEEEETKIPEALELLAEQVHDPNVQPEETHKQFSVYKEFGDRRELVVSARTYFYSGESECDKNAEMFCRCIDATSQATQGQGFIAIKLTALGRPRLFIRLSEAIAQMHNLFKVITGSSWENLFLSQITEAQLLEKLNEFGVKTDSVAVREWFKQVDFDDNGIVDFFEWGQLLDLEERGAVKQLDKMFQILNIKTGRLEPLIQNLSKTEMRECANMMGRLNKVADHAFERGIRIMVDAEQTYFQPAISRLTNALMRRGAYMEQERLRAATVGYEDPINPTCEATSEMYHKCLAAIVDEWLERGRSSASVMVASHNLDSIRYAVELSKKWKIAPSERVICFGQLYGMCDVVGELNGDEFV